MMGIRHVPPPGIWPGIHIAFGKDRHHGFAIAIGMHSWQCDQRWYGIRIGRLRLGYRTRGDASPDLMTYYDGGFWWPWQTDRTCSGAWL